MSDITRGMTEAEIGALSGEARQAWMASMSEAEAKVLHCPAGWRSTLVIISDLKRTLVRVQMTAGARLHILETLEGQSTGFITPEAVAAIKPADDVGAQIIAEAHSLGYEYWNGDRRRKCFWDVIDNLGTFWTLARLNPSLMDAIDLCGK